MSKGKTTIIKIVVAVLIVMLGVGIFYISIISEVNEFAKEVDKETRGIIKKHVDRFVSIGFRGIVSQKSINSESTEKEFQVLIELDNHIDSTIFKETYFIPMYYSFPKENEIQIFVTKEFYDKVTEGDSVKKEPNEIRMKFNGNYYQFLSDDTLEWLKKS